jgi:hypothetical protein
MITSLIRNIYGLFTYKETLDYRKQGILSRCTRAADFKLDTDLVSHRFSFDGRYESFESLIKYIQTNFENHDHIKNLAKRGVFNYLDINGAREVIIFRNGVPNIVISNYKVINPAYDYSVLIH